MSRRIMIKAAAEAAAQASSSDEAILHAEDVGDVTDATPAISKAVIKTGSAFIRSRKYGRKLPARRAYRKKYVPRRRYVPMRRSYYPRRSIYRRRY